MRAGELSGRGRKRGEHFERYLPEPPDVACHPARDSPVLARSAPASPNQHCPARAWIGLPKCGGGFQIKLLGSKTISSADLQLSLQLHSPIAEQPELICRSGRTFD